MLLLTIVVNSHLHSYQVRQTELKYPRDYCSFCLSVDVQLAIVFVTNVTTKRGSGTQMLATDMTVMCAWLHIVRVAHQVKLIPVPCLQIVLEFTLSQSKMF